MADGESKTIFLMPMTTAAIPDSAPLVAVEGRFTGATIETALEKFEDHCSEEDVDILVIQERAERGDGVLVSYEVRWRYSVFDDHAYDIYVSQALLVAVDPAAGDPPDARFRVASATAEHHNL